MIEQQLVINRAVELIDEFHNVREEQDRLLNEILNSLQDYADILDEQLRKL